MKKTFSKKFIKREPFKSKVVKFENYTNLNRPEWDGILSITADWYEKGICVTITIIKDGAPVDGLALTFTRGTLVEDLRDPVVLKKWREMYGDYTVDAFEDALDYINQVMHESFLPMSAGETVN